MVRREDLWPDRIYAIGDIHGRLDLLQELEAKILADAALLPGRSLIVTLGDYIDRGPESAGVLRHLRENQSSVPERVCLLGNHEAMLLDFIRDPSLSSAWLRNGADATIRSLGGNLRILNIPYDRRRDAMIELVGPANLAFLQSLPRQFNLPGVCFVHAGLHPDFGLDDQDPSDFLWIRSPFLQQPRKDDVLVVHGHTVATEPQVLPWRIGIDTGAYSTGILTAVRIDQDKTVKFFQATYGASADA